jgi:hypothetical protein
MLVPNYPRRRPCLDGRRRARTPARAVHARAAALRVVGHTKASRVATNCRRRARIRLVRRPVVSWKRPRGSPNSRSDPSSGCPERTGGDRAARKAFRSRLRVRVVDERTPVCEGLGDRSALGGWIAFVQVGERMEFRVDRPNQVLIERRAQAFVAPPDGGLERGRLGATEVKRQPACRDREREVVQEQTVGAVVGAAERLVPDKRDGDSAGPCQRAPRAA